MDLSSLQHLSAQVWNADRTKCQRLDLPSINKLVLAHSHASNTFLEDARDSPGSISALS